MMMREYYCSLRFSSEATTSVATASEELVLIDSNTGSGLVGMEWYGTGCLQLPIRHQKRSGQDWWKYKGLGNLKL